MVATRSGTASPVTDSMSSNTVISRKTRVI
jgi:hypothetical protein